MSAITHLEKLRFEKSKAVVLVQCPHDTSGIEMFAYIKVDKAGYDKLMQAYENGAWGKFSEYGEVILFGEGEPNEKTRQFIQENEW